MFHVVAFKTWHIYSHWHVSFCHVFCSLKLIYPPRSRESSFIPFKYYRSLHGDTVPDLIFSPLTDGRLSCCHFPSLQAMLQRTSSPRTTCPCRNYKEGIQRQQEPPGRAQRGHWVDLFFLGTSRSFSGVATWPPAFFLGFEFQNMANICQEHFVKLVEEFTRPCNNN